MKINNLLITQNHIRHSFDFIKELARFSENNKFEKIAIIQTPDEKLWIRDGLHRCISILLGRKEKSLYKEEYIIEKFTYEQVNSFNFSKRFFTPFDLNTEVRRFDTTFFKKIVDDLLKWKDDEEYIRKYIISVSYLYKDTRLEIHNDIEKFLEKEIKNA